jgi:hypothetical protein
MVRSGGKPICRNFESSKELDEKWIEALVNGDTSYKNKARKTMKFYSHMGAEDPDFWANAFKFTVERHPYEKTVSKAFFKLGPHASPERFPEMLDKILRKENYATIQYYSINNKIVVDDIVKLENLKSDLERVASKVGVALPAEVAKNEKHCQARSAIREGNSDASAERRNLSRLQSGVRFTWL